MTTEQQRLVTDNLQLSSWVADRFFRKYQRLCPREEMISAGYVGLVKAAKKFDQSQAIKFSPFAVRAIRWKIHREIEKHSKKGFGGYAAEWVDCSILSICMQNQKGWVSIGEIWEGNLPQTNNNESFNRLSNSIECADLLKPLTRRERRIIQLHFWEDWNFARIGKRFRICGETARTIKEKVLQKIRKRVRKHD